MTPKQAYELLDQVASLYKGQRQDHEILLQALQVIKKLVDQEKSES
jgi:streptomycin 6-kinase